eukprot:superscaffoldBa00000322_g3790
MGQINPTVRLYVVNLDGSSQTTELRPPDSFEKSEYYITMVKWVTQEKLTVRWVNRAQNMSILSLCDVTTEGCTKKHVMTSEKWLDRQNEEPVFSKDCTIFFITMPLKQGGRGSFNHITMISNQSEGQEVNLRHLTSGSWEVSQILAYDESTNSVDSAPGGQAVSDRFALSWDSVLVSSDRVIVARLDGRGSGFQGQGILQEVHQRLGTVDVKDQITVLEHLIRLPYINGNKVGVYGKAYGGFLASLLLLSHSSVFRCGIAVAPITNWRLYGSAFTEKYFGSPAKEDHKYQIFPDEGHHIVSVKSQHYMLSSVITFFKHCFEEEKVAVPQTSEEDD